MAAYEGKRFRPKQDATAAGTGAAGRGSAPRHAAPRTGASGSSAPRHAAPRTGAFDGSAPRHAAPRPAASGNVEPPRTATSRHAAVPPRSSARRDAASPHAVGISPAHPTNSRYARSGQRGRSNASKRDQRRAPQSRRSSRDIVSKVLIGVGAILLLAAAWIFISAQIGYHKAHVAYDELSQYVTLDDSTGDGVPVVDWEALAKESEDIVAWIYVPNTDISFPVVQGDTNDQYLRALPDGTWNESGSIMLDCDQQAPGMVGQQTTVYGHHMSDGSMFDPIENTLDQAKFDEMTTVYYLTPETTYKLSPLFTSRVPETYVEARQETFGDHDALVAYLEDLRTYAKAQASDVDERLASTDRVLALVTCSGLAPADHRAVMICTIVEETSTAQ
ncbi:sortase [Enorma sp.]|uniref:class B sortase n=1 Tax=Enorma sp. TaxID=1920692 RepID=UPI0025BD2564|nr:sortase [Enorma sp.]